MTMTSSKHRSSFLCKIVTFRDPPVQAQQGTCVVLGHRGHMYLISRKSSKSPASVNAMAAVCPPDRLASEPAAPTGKHCSQGSRWRQPLRKRWPSFRDLLTGWSINKKRELTRERTEISTIVVEHSVDLQFVRFPAKSYYCQQSSRRTMAQVLILGKYSCILCCFYELTMIQATGRLSLQLAERTSCTTFCLLAKLSAGWYKWRCLFCQWVCILMTVGQTP